MSELKGKITPTAAGGITVTRPYRGPWMPKLGMKFNYKGNEMVIGGYSRAMNDDTDEMEWWLYLAPAPITANDAQEQTR